MARTHPKFPREVNHGSVIHVETGELYPFRPMEIQAVRAWPRPWSRRLQPDIAWKGFPPHLHLPGGLVFAQRLAVIEYRPESPTVPLEELPSLRSGSAVVRTNDLTRLAAGYDWRSTEEGLGLFSANGCPGDGQRNVESALPSCGPRENQFVWTGLGWDAGPTGRRGDPLPALWWASRWWLVKESGRPRTHWEPPGPPESPHSQRHSRNHIFCERETA